MKVCTKCKISKDLIEFGKNSHSKDKLSYYCKLCRNTANKLWLSQGNNRQLASKLSAEWYFKTKEKRKQQIRKYLRKPETKIRRNLYMKKLRKNPIFRMHASISSHMNESLRCAYRNKDRRSWETLVGYTKEDLKIHLESLFKDGMSWDNYGKWHIDHIRPVASFNITSAECEDFKKCWALENLQPLWAEENFKKNKKWTV